jgi:hypothetical protein
VVRWRVTAAPRGEQLSSAQRQLAVEVENLVWLDPSGESEEMVARQVSSPADVEYECSQVQLNESVVNGHTNHRERRSLRFLVSRRPIFTTL